MANQALIQGAYAAAPKFSEAGDAFSSAFEGRMQQFNKATEEANAKREELFSLVDNIELDDLGNTPEMTAAIMAEAKNAQNEYFEKIKNTNPFNPELRLEANKASQKINQLQALSATHQAFIKDIQDNKDLLSKVNGPDAYKRAMDFASFSIEKDKDGNYNFKDKEGNIVTRKQLSEYQDNLLEVPVTIYNDLAATTAKLKGQPSFDGIKPMLIAKINTALADKAYGEDFLFDSLGGSSNPLDKSDVGGGMRIAKYAGKTKAEILALAPEGSEAQKIEFLRKEVTDGYMKAFEESHRLLNPQKAVEAKTEKQSEGDKKREIEDYQNTLLKTQIGTALNKIKEKQEDKGITPSEITKLLQSIPNIQVIVDEDKDGKKSYSIVNTASATSMNNPISIGSFDKAGWGTRAIKSIEDVLNLSVEYRQGTKVPPHLRNK